MACATLKRSLEWEPVLGSRPTKRRRCNPFCSSPSQQTDVHISSHSSSPSTSSASMKSIFPDIVSKKFTSGTSCTLLMFWSNFLFAIKFINFIFKNHARCVTSADRQLTFCLPFLHKFFRALKIILIDFSALLLYKKNFER